MVLRGVGPWLLRFSKCLHGLRRVAIIGGGCLATISDRCLATIGGGCLATIGVYGISLLRVALTLLPVCGGWPLGRYLRHLHVARQVLR